MKRLSLFYMMLFAVPLIASDKQIEAIIQDARATVGEEAALEGLVTLKMSGRIEPADPKLPVARILLIARKPCSQRVEVNVDNLVETTLLDGSSGCIIRSNLESVDERSQIRRMTAEEIRRMTFNTRQLFSFYRGHPKQVESVSYEGIEPRRGMDCHKLVYSYPQGISITRYFSVDRKELVSTVTDKNVENVEVGTQTVAGIRFPKRIEYYVDDKLLHTLVLETIEVNKPLQVGVFTVPAVQETK